ncbi:pentapeptide repeat-containing protein [Rhodovulum visakhapatnamense]|uniref:Pentapeptide repeat protein n=1 Tax=Rhodovulum visakhapatnamense TaxID=364297 RepID=A0A4R8G1Y9_9RHOB|nr:pentapeptide repeat-containing protein [Rhodovulum visakhapatnamense]TDX33727.1 pentapeptide repeat protein [Rhodovulum visakhapatnamense]
MGNPQHLEWLLEGVEAWNARQKREELVPDLSGMDFRRAFQNAGKLVFSRIPLWLANLVGADLGGANLRGANLKGADLGGANLEGANLVGADLGGANLRGANLKGADLGGADLGGADLGGADVRTVYSGVRTNDVSTPEYTDLSQTLALTQAQCDTMLGDTGTILPEGLHHPAHWPDPEPPDSEDTEDKIDLALTVPLVRASALDFEITETGVEAITPPGQALDGAIFGPGCVQRAEALIENARSLAASLSNKLGHDMRADLRDYARHLAANDNGNPHRLVFLAAGLRGDLVDPIVASAFSERLKAQLGMFLDQHDDFLRHCLPQTHEAALTKENADLARTFTKEEATEILDRLEGAIATADATTASVAEALGEFRAVDEKLNALKIKAFGPEENEKLERAVQREAVELGALSARLYWRAQQVVARTRLHAGDLAIVATLTGKSAPQMAQIIVHYLQPLMHKLGAILPGLPPV